MKISSVSKFVGAGVIAASLAVVPLTVPAQAQNTAPNTTTQQDSTQQDSTQQNSNVDATGPIRDNTERDNNDWGWLGLLGLIGLAGLARKDRRETVHQVNTDPQTGVRSGSDYR